MFLFLGFVVVMSLGCMDFASKSKDKSIMETLFAIFVTKGIAQEVPTITGRKIWNNDSKTWVDFDCTSGTYSIGSEAGEIARIRIYSNVALHPVLTTNDGIALNIVGIDNEGKYFLEICLPTTYSTIFDGPFTAWTWDDFIKLTNGSCKITVH
ncbi:MAG TPA: hypothetical protein P5136_01620 [Methanofastidiosum sp.]|nr:hypothetical protein [Methanofastidiosum sp.]